MITCTILGILNMVLHPAGTMNCENSLGHTCGCVWSLSRVGVSRVGVSRVARVCLCLASPVRFVPGLAPASLPFGAHAVKRVPCPSL
jgi:hypothetical protein